MASDFFLRENKRNFFFLFFFFGEGSTCSFSAEAVHLSAEVTCFSTSVSAGVPGFSVVATCLFVEVEVPGHFSVELICFPAKIGDVLSTVIDFSAEVTFFSEGANGFREGATCFLEVVMDFWEEVEDVATDTDFLPKLTCFSEEVNGFWEEVNELSVDFSFSVEVHVTCFTVAVGFLLEVTSPIADSFVETVDFSEVVGFLAFKSCSASVRMVTGWLSWKSS